LVLEDRKVEYAHILRKRYNDMGENIDWFLQQAHSMINIRRCLYWMMYLQFIYKKGHYIRPYHALCICHLHHKHQASCLYAIVMCKFCLFINVFVHHTSLISPPPHAWILSSIFEQEKGPEGPRKLH
jgi:hypothetical protein